MLCIGLTGGVGSGKSYVLKLFEQLGVPVIEADDVGRAVVQPGEPALAEIAAHFGPEFLLADGALDRRRLRERVFNDPAALKQLEALTHPHIQQALRDWRDRQTAPYGLLSAAILLESSMHRLVSRVLVVDAPEHDQLARVMRRDGIDEALARAMLARQLSRAERLARADDVLENPEPAADLSGAVASLHRRYLRLAATE